MIFQSKHILDELYVLKYDYVFSEVFYTICIRRFLKTDAGDAADIWNRVVEDGVAFPQLETLSPEEAADFFEAQDFTGIAFDSETEEIVGLYILHPNNIGRCGHICNASYAVSSHSRGLHIGEKLVLDCIEQGRKHGFSVLQFNAVVATNTHARHLYERLGFTQLGIIPNGFRMKDGYYEDICPYYRAI